MQFTAMTSQLHDWKRAQGGVCATVPERAQEGRAICPVTNTQWSERNA